MFGPPFEALSRGTRVPQAANFQEAVEGLLEKSEEPKKASEWQGSDGTVDKQN
jgi:hypothetical protein